MLKKTCMALGLMSATALGGALSSPAFAEDTAPLTVNVTDLRSSEGDVHIALYKDPDTFPKPKIMYQRMEVPIEGGVATWTFDGLEPGTYAIAVFHDENKSGGFDQGLFGIPLEDFGFSNNATVFLGPPSFEAAAFQVLASGSVVTISLGNNETASATDDMPQN